ncbi:MAG: PilZ domain-containing protein [Thermodesulfobacteriota bacterium]|nr:PilZ domain-containing protein [Thermodesulfobacteriota bacterium]
MSDDKRRFTRVPFRVQAEITVDESSYYTEEIKNLSVGGCLLPVAAPLDVGTACHVRIQLSGTSSELHIEIDAQVVRCCAGEVAVKFTGVDLDSFFHLQNIVRYNSPDPDAVEEELRAHLGLVRSLRED